MDSEIPSRAPLTGVADAPVAPASAAAAAPSFPLHALDLLPLAVHVRGRLDVGFPEDVRVAADDLAADRLVDVGHVEYAGFRRELCVKHDLEVEIAEFAGQIGRGPGVEGVVDLVRLLEEVLLQ